MRAIRDFILFFVVVIIEIIRLIFEIDDCGIFDDFVFFLCFFLSLYHLLVVAAGAKIRILQVFADGFLLPLRERYFLPDLS